MAPVHPGRGQCPNAPAGRRQRTPSGPGRQGRNRLGRRRRPYRMIAPEVLPVSDACSTSLTCPHGLAANKFLMNPCPALNGKDRAAPCHQVHRMPPAWLAAWLANRPDGSVQSPRKGTFTRGSLEGRLGFEPTTRGLKVSPVAVHGVVSSALVSTSRAVPVHGLHPLVPKLTAVAVTVAVSRLAMTTKSLPSEGVNDAKPAASITSAYSRDPVRGLQLRRIFHAWNRDDPARRPSHSSRRCRR